MQNALTVKVEKHCTRAAHFATIFNDNVFVIIVTIFFSYQTNAFTVFCHFFLSFQDKKAIAMIRYNRIDIIDPSLGK